jgi:hypothetical protein
MADGEVKKFKVGDRIKAVETATYYMTNTNAICEVIDTRTQPDVRVYVKVIEFLPEHHAHRYEDQEAILRERYWVDPNLFNLFLVQEVEPPRHTRWDLIE